MSVDQQELRERVERARTDAALELKEPIQNPRDAARIIPFIVAILIGIALIVAIFVLPQVR